ncbi:hypothetical protein ONZ45_g17880 [Pleurotus djamor]|nr:hypothetical protein ONZ45_g17880 [Pleurotus djamor]
MDPNCHSNTERKRTPSPYSLSKRPRRYCRNRIAENDQIDVALPAGNHTQLDLEETDDDEAFGEAIIEQPNPMGTPVAPPLNSEEMDDDDEAFAEA